MQARDLARIPRGYPELAWSLHGARDLPPEQIAARRLQHRGIRAPEPTVEKRQDLRLLAFALTARDPLGKVEEAGFLAGSLSAEPAR